MSTYWDVYCLDCGAESGLHLRSGRAACRELVRGRAGLETLAACEIDDIEVRVPGERGYIELSFYKDHIGHILAAVSEYGEIDGDCNELDPGPMHGRCREYEDHPVDRAHAFVETSPWKEGWRTVREKAAARRRQDGR